MKDYANNIINNGFYAMTDSMSDTIFRCPSSTLYDMPP